MKTDDTEVMKVLESLVADNEALKRDGAELQNLLAESREDLRALQEEMEERRAGDSSYWQHRSTNSGQSELTDHPVSPLSSTFPVGTAPSASILHSWHRQGNLGRRPVSTERSSRRAFVSDRRLIREKCTNSSAGAIDSRDRTPATVSNRLIDSLGDEVDLLRSTSIRSFIS